MTGGRARTVALVDPLWIGHHPMYFNQFTASFLRCGVRVVGLCPDPEAARENLAKSADCGNPAEVTRFAKLPTGKRSFFNGRFEGDPVRTLDRWRKAADTLSRTEETCGWRADLVFFPYLDSYLRFLPVPLVPDVILNRPWSGLYLRNHHHGENASVAKSLRLLAKGDAILRSRCCLGVGVLDERFIPAMESLTGKMVTAFPDVTQGGLPCEPFPLALEIRRKAGGRTIIGMIGLERRKGFLTFLRAAELARRSGLACYFVAAGVFLPDGYSAPERAEIMDFARAVAGGEIDNLHFDPQGGRIRDEADFNSLFSSFDIAWAAFEGFQGSSGTLSKAALFEIPCIGTAGECIGMRIERYRMGVTVPEASPNHALTAILGLLEMPAGAGGDSGPDYAAYREDHSVARLDRILMDLLERL